jgi:hypothetical protein
MNSLLKIITCCIEMMSQDILARLKNAHSQSPRMLNRETFQMLGSQYLVSILPILLAVFFYDHDLLWLQRFRTRAGIYPEVDACYGSSATQAIETPSTARSRSMSGSLRPPGSSSYRSRRLRIWASRL